MSQLVKNMNEKIRILFLSANPWSTVRIRVDEEAREIFLKLEASPGRDTFEFLKYPASRSDDLQLLLMKHKPQIVHFSGHGTLAQGILLEGVSARSKKVESRTLVNLFRLFNDHVRLIVLNACFSKQQAMALTEVVDYAIGASTAIGDRASIAFTGAFYSALAYGMSVQQAFEYAKTGVKLRNLRRSKGFELFAREGAGTTVFLPRRHNSAFTDVRPPVIVEFRHPLDDQSRRDDKSLINRAEFDGNLIGTQTNRGLERANRPDRESKAPGSGIFRTQKDRAVSPRIEDQLSLSPLRLAIQLPGRIFVGREDSLIDVKGLLRSASRKETEAKVIVVRGWPGVGKTTFVGELGCDPEVLKEFPDGVLWTLLGQKPELMTNLAEWSGALGTDDLLGPPTLDEAITTVAERIQDRRILLIVDDIWNPAHAIPFLKAVMGTSCALLATTRVTEVAVALTNDDRNTYVLPVLSEASSLLLLRSLASIAVDEYPDQCRTLVRDCGYLPLALQVAGRLLKAEAKMGLSVVDLIERISEGTILLKERAPIHCVEGTILPTTEQILQRSTDTLDELTRNYFACLAPSTPQPATFDPAAMKAIWQVDDPLPIIRTLVGQGLLESVGDGCFQVHELLVSHARSLAQIVAAQLHPQE